MSETLHQFGDRLDAAASRLPDALLDEAAELADSVAARARRLAAQRMKGSGALQAIRGEARASGSTITARVFGDTRAVPWLRIQEEGGTIEARGGGYLVIPQPDGSYRRVHRVTLRPLHFIADAMVDARADARTALLLRVRRTIGGSGGV
jgi:hypothetical protein